MHFRYSPKSDVSSPPWPPPLRAKRRPEQVQQCGWPKLRLLDDFVSTQQT